MKSLFIILALALTGCATQDYKAYADAQAASAQAKAQADTARYAALSKIAETGTESARVAAVMALAIGNQQAPAGQQIAAPQPSQALQWAQVLAPSITSIASMHYSSRASMASAESAARVSESTNAAFVGIASKIQAPAANVSTVTTNNANQANTTTTTSNANPTTSTTTTTTTADGKVCSVDAAGLVNCK